jgi:hypothetical protein
VRKREYRRGSVPRRCRASSIALLINCGCPSADDKVDIPCHYRARFADSKGRESGSYLDESLGTSEEWARSIVAAWNPEDNNGQLHFAHGYLVSITKWGMRKSNFELRQQVRHIRRRTRWRTWRTRAHLQSRSITLTAHPSGFSKTATELGGLAWQGCQGSWRSSFRIAYFAGIFHGKAADPGQSRDKDATTHNLAPFGQQRSNGSAADKTCSERWHFSRRSTAHASTRRRDQ